jgi:very-short-patch-repair endonuclease
VLDEEPLDVLVARQGGVLTRQQALAGGVTRATIEAHVQGGRWQRVLGRVYAVFTGPPPRRSQLWAVVLRAGRGAMLSHETAAELVGLVGARGDRRQSPAVHVTVPADRRVARIPGAVVHLSGRAAAARHPTRLPPQTRVEETVLDLADAARSVDDALGWVARACARRLTTPARLRVAMAERAKLRWRAELTAALRDVADGCHSVLELRYLRDVERPHGLPGGERQAVRQRRGGRWYDDVHYREYRTRVELDGRAAHPEEARFRDMRRDNAAAVDGETVLRYGWPDVTGDPCAGALQVATVLRRNGWTGVPRPCCPGCVIAKSLTGWDGPDPS